MFRKMCYHACLSLPHPVLPWASSHRSEPRSRRDPSRNCLHDAIRSGVRRDGNTYSNDCVAGVAGSEILYYGECAEERQPEFRRLPGDFEPVCGIDGNTYPNAVFRGRRTDRGRVDR